MTVTIVIDSCVFNKLYLDEQDRDDAIEFLEEARRRGVRLIAPSLFTCEVLAVAAASTFGATAAWALVQHAIRSGFEIFELDSPIVETAITIAGNGNRKSGFPSFYDAIYHALAITTGGVFLTADARHVAKTASLGSVVLLSNWKTCFAA